MTTSATEISKNLQHIRAAIAHTAKKYHRTPEAITLVAVTKAQPLEKIKAAIATNQVHFAQNYLQEALPKITSIQNNDLVWHYIGRIQSNKIKLIAANFSWVETVTNYKTALLLNQHRSDNLPPLNICIQVNLQQETSKNGIAPKETLALAQQIVNLPKLKLRGLMAIPQPTSEFTQQVTTFKALATLLHQLQQQGLDVDTLSMGMSQDYEAAIAAGATMVRIGTGIFGKREI